MATVAITEEKKKHILNLIKSFKAIDSAMTVRSEEYTMQNAKCTVLSAKYRLQHHVAFCSALQRFAALFAALCSALRRVAACCGVLRRAACGV